jgi:hypothetical protein
VAKRNVPKGVKGAKPKGIPFRGNRVTPTATPDQYDMPIGPEPINMYSSPIGPEPTMDFKRKRLEDFKADMIARRDANRARRGAQIESIKRGQKVRRYAKMGGLAALAGLGAGLAYNRYERATGSSDEQLMDKALFDLMAERSQTQMNGLAEDARAESYDDAINRNLQRIQQNAPDLYMAVAAGRRLPTGAVVLGGAPRTDLLQDLGRSMADGQYNQ